MVLNRRGNPAVIACIAALATSCGGDDTARESSGIVATTSIWADITSEVLCNAPVTTLIPAGADPHDFEASLSDRELLENADVIIANGGGLEGQMLVLIDTVASSGVEVVEMMPVVETIEDDPHIWQDPLRVIDTIDAIAAVAVAAGLDADAVAVCADAYRDRLSGLDIEIAGQLAPIPPESRLMVTSHDSLAYFANRYGLEIVGTVIPATNTLAESNAADLAALADTIEAQDVPAVFTEELESSSDADRLAQRLGVAVVPLVTDALTDDPGGDTYIEMMRSNATAIAETLAP
jgi:zinc/manganese transport system substrate-binding protein